MRRTKLSIFYFCALLLLLWGCSITSNQAKFGKQEFNDLTSHDNAWFNCNDKMNNTMKLAEQYHKDKFDSVIPVYFYTDPKEFSSYSSDLDDIIKRTTVAIQLHNIANWTDDNFLLIGEAQFLKGDYDKANNTFKYITTQFKEGVDYVKVMRALGKKVGKYVPAKKRPPKPQVQVIVNKDGTQTLEKVDNRPEISFWLHTPARSEALIWLIKTYTRQKKYDQAASVITYTRGDNLFYKNYDKDLNLADADLRVTQKKYAAAIAPLEKYLSDKKVVHNKKLRVRPLFVLAQCYAATGNAAKAIENYNKVLKSHPNYDMEFYAKLKMAKIGRNGTGDPAEMRSLLAKMAKDSKYKDYWDQVYYELALLSLAENNKSEGINLLHQSVAYSTKNEDQKATSYLKIADLNYDDELFVPAKFYYDSTLSLLAKSDTRYPGVQERDKLLSNLVKQLAIIAQEDSLQKLAALSPQEQLKAVRDAIAAKERADAQAKAEASQQKMQQQLVGLSGNPNNKNQQNAGNWYFYNETTKSLGYNEFVKRWGKRTLEENWRRANKNQAISDEDTTSADTTVAVKDTLKGTEEERLLAGIPNDSGAYARSVDKAINAYYAAGTIYKDGLESYENAWYMFATMNEKYPNHKLLLESYYNLYLIAQKQKKDDEMEKYKDLILKQFPESVIAKILRDPNYVNEAKKEENLADNYYSSAFDDYSTGRLDSAWYKCEMSDVVLKPNPLSARFQLLGALILAKENRLTDYLQALNKIINKSSDATIKKTATDLLAMLNKSKLQQVDLSKDPARRDSLNEKYKIVPVVSNAPDTSSENNDIIKKMNAARDAAIKSGKFKPDTTGATAMINKPAPKDNAPTTGTAGNNSASKDTAASPASTGAKTASDTGKKAPAVMQADTTSPYKRTDNDVHYVIVYINDTVKNSDLMSTMALLNAYNSTQSTFKGLSTQTKLINAANQVLRIVKFKNRDEAMGYYKILKAQTQLFSALKPYKYSVAAISDTNYKVLFGTENIDEYNKYFKRVYLSK